MTNHCGYLTKDTRGQGIGLQLMRKLKLFAVKNKLNMIPWQTPNDNTPAIGFHQKLGAIKKVKQRFFWPTWSIAKQRAI